jgi:signal transduction histidine kinase
LERIKIDENIFNSSDDAVQTTGNKIYEIQQMDVVFEMEPNRMIILRDITELTQKEYNRSIAKLIEIMVASTSHDMRTPLNTIINMHDMIESKIKDPHVLNWLKIARSSSNLLLYLVNDTLDYF